jgi:hypothetical protein
MYKIELDVPIPEHVRGAFGETLRKYPFDDMNIGDSFWARRDEEPSLRVAASSWGKRHGAKFKIARVTERDTPVLRCWRVECID